MQLSNERADEKFTITLKSNGTSACYINFQIVLDRTRTVDELASCRCQTRACGLPIEVRNTKQVFKPLNASGYHRLANIRVFTSPVECRLQEGRLHFLRQS